MSYKTVINNGFTFYEFPNGDSYENLHDAWLLPYKTITRHGIDIDLYHANGHYGATHRAVIGHLSAHGLSEENAINRVIAYRIRRY